MRPDKKNGAGIALDQKRIHGVQGVRPETRASERDVERERVVCE